MQLTNRNIILTGAASGIGRALLILLATQPCQIIAADIDAVQLDAAIAALPQPVARVTSFQGDLAQSAAIDRLFASAQQTIGGCDLFIANAGFAYYEQLERADWQHIERIFALNTYGPIYTTLKMRDLNQHQPYCVVITASAMAKFAVPGYALYGATKAALDRFAEAFRYELAPHGRLMLVYPIATRTNFFRAANRTSPPIPWPSQTPEQVARAILRGIATNATAVFPSPLFWWTWKIAELFPPVRWAYQWWQQRVLLG